MSKERIEQESLQRFIQKTSIEKDRFLSSINLHELQGTVNRSLLKKFIAMKVFFETENAIKKYSNSRFREFLGKTISPDLALKLYNNSQQNQILEFEAEEESNEENSSFLKDEQKHESSEWSYHFFHYNQMGAIFWQQKFFYIGFNQNDATVIQTKRVYTTGTLSKITTINEDIKNWDNLTDSDQLRALFTAIKTESRYENTFGYDLFCLAMYGANVLLELSWNCNKVLCIPLALLFNVAIYAFITPLALSTFVLEKLIMQPLEWCAEACKKEDYADFIEEVTDKICMA